MKPLSKYRLSKRAHEFFGGDVQQFQFMHKGNGVYLIQQIPHWGNPRVVALNVAGNARDAAKSFNAMARDDERNHR